MIFAVSPNQSFRVSHRAFDTLCMKQFILMKQAHQNCIKNEEGKKKVVQEENENANANANAKANANMKSSGGNASLDTKKVQFHCHNNDNDNNSCSNAKVNHHPHQQQQQQQQHSINPSRQQQQAITIVEQKTPIHHEETAEVAKISFDVAGFTADDIDIQVLLAEDDDHVVCVTAKRKNKLGDVFVIHRRFRLDKKTADEEQVSANHLIDDGVLEIIVKKKKPNTVGRRPRTISISTVNTAPSSSSSSSPTSMVDETFVVSKQQQQHQPPPPTSHQKEQDDNTDNKEAAVTQAEDNVNTVQSSKKYLTEETDQQDEKKQEQQQQEPVKVETVDEEEEEEEEEKKLANPSIASPIIIVQWQMKLGRKCRNRPVVCPSSSIIKTEK